MIRRDVYQANYRVCNQSLFPVQKVACICDPDTLWPVFHDAKQVQLDKSFNFEAKQHNITGLRHIIFNKTCTDGSDKGSWKYNKPRYIERGNISEKLKFENTNSEKKCNNKLWNPLDVFLKQKNMCGILHIPCLSVVETEGWDWRWMITKKAK